MRGPPALPRLRERGPPTGLPLPLEPAATWPAAALSYKSQSRLPRANAQEDFFERVLDKKFLKTIDLIWDNPPVRPALYQPRAFSRASEQHLCKQHISQRSSRARRSTRRQRPRRRSCAHSQRAACPLPCCFRFRCYTWPLYARSSICHRWGGGDPNPNPNPNLNPTPNPNLTLTLTLTGAGHHPATRPRLQDRERGGAFQVPVLVLLSNTAAARRRVYRRRRGSSSYRTRRGRPGRLIIASTSRERAGAHPLFTPRCTPRRHSRHESRD